MPIFIDRVLALRKHIDVSQTDVALAININLRTYQRYEKGEREPRMSELISLADYFGVSLDYLVGRSDNPNRL